MAKMRDNGPALRALRDLGHRLSRFNRIQSVEDSFWMRSPDGQERRIKIQKSGVPTGKVGRANSRHRYGITFRSFDVVDDIVFWAKDEEVLYIVPTAVLNDIFHRPGQTPKLLQKAQWEAHIYFDSHELTPTGYGESFSLAEYSRQIPQGQETAT